MERTYWQSLQQLHDGMQRTPECDDADAVEREFAGANRRDFLKAAGFSLAAVLAAGCTRAPVERAIPYLVKPEELTPGVASWYASTCHGCAAGCGALVKTRDGRPIKLEGNSSHAMSAGALCAAGQASILGLYDSQRLKQPLVRGNTVKWEDADREVMSRLDEIRRTGGAVRYLSGSITSPTKRAAITAFLASFKGSKHVIYDSLSASAILDAHERTHKVRMLPRYLFGRARLIAGIDADFLGTWISPVEYTLGYTAGRRLPQSAEDHSHHVQFESRLSLTGAKADRRLRIRPDQQRAVLMHLATRLGFAGNAEPLPQTIASAVDTLAEEIRKHRGESLIVCGSQDSETQVLCNVVNELAGNYGTTIDLERPSFQRQGSDSETQQLLEDIVSGNVAALFIDGVNPVFELGRGDSLAASLKNIPLVVSFGTTSDETTAAATVCCPDHHYLESWSDTEAVAGIASLTQPAVEPLGGTRAVVETLSIWMGHPASSYDLIRENWRTNIHPRYEARALPFDAFWDQVLHDGFVTLATQQIAAKPFDYSAAVFSKAENTASEDSLRLVLYPKVALLDGRAAFNPWLHELPDPITKATWDNYACISPKTAQRLGLSDGDVAQIRPASGGEPALELPVLVQAGQHDDVVAAAIGYGSVLSKRFANVGPRWLHSRTTVGPNGLVGSSVQSFLAFKDGTLRYDAFDVRLTRAGRRHEIACTQSHHSLSVPEHLAPTGGAHRPIILETTLAHLKEGAEEHGGHHIEADMWPSDHEHPGQKWGMVIDLAACTGCSACVVSCQVENNIPVVGKDEVRRKREMHWIRIDRYYAGDEDNVDVAYQPMLCQHCDNAPCETVCPVIATVHSADGINQQIYNRCVGTRYCANNCPYKTRRFNWFDYPHDDLLANMVLNPDVTVRSRGVMEKCSFCAQRIQESRIQAANEGRPMLDSDLQTACQQSCPAHAITFGDLHAPNSKVAAAVRDGRYFKVLEETNVKPSVGYLMIVRNRRDEKEEATHG